MTQEPKTTTEDEIEAPPSRMGMVIVSIVMSAIGAALILLSEFQAGFFSLIWVLGGMLLLGFGLSMLWTAMKPATVISPIKVITELRCRSCDYKEVRDFKRGDYIMKKGEKCPKCSANLYIYGVVSLPPPTEKPEEEL